MLHKLYSLSPGTKLKGVRGVAHRAKTAVQSTSAGQLTGPRTIGELLLVEKDLTDKSVRWATSHTHPNKFSDVTSVVESREHVEHFQFVLII